MSTQPNPVLEHALSLAAQRIYVNAIEPNSKALVNTGPVLDSATRDPDEIAEIFGDNPALNLGVVTGPESDLVVIDIDVKGSARGDEAFARLRERCDFPPTLQETTPSGGRHLHYRLDGANLKNGKLIVSDMHGVEVFARPHNVVVAPSVIDGARYQITEDREIVRLPPATAEVIRSVYATESKTNGPVLEGGRNNGLFREASRMRHLDMAQADAWERLRTLNSTECKPPLPERELKKLFESAWKYPPGYQPTDLGNRDRFLDRHGANLRVVAESRRWLHWNDLRFVDDTSRKAEALLEGVVHQMLLDAINMPGGPDDKARNAAITWGRISERHQRLQAALALAATPDTIVAQKDLDADPWLFSAKNAIIDLRTGKPIRADQSQLITKVANMTYERGATCPIWIKFLERALPDPEARAFFQRFTGYSLTGMTSEQCLLLAYGPTHTGKTTALQTLEHAWGDYAKKTPTTTWLTKGRDAISNDLAALAGVRLAISTEFDRGVQWSASLVKSVTGQESVTARFLFQEFFTYTPQFKPLFGTNHLPSYDGSDAALTRRLRPLEFRVQIPEDQRDGTLQEKLRAELPGIFNWLLDGCLEWQRHGLQEPATVKTAKEQYATDNDDIAAFIDECCETGAAFSEKSGPLHARYKAWCDDHRTRAVAASAFKAALLKRGFTHDRVEKARMFFGLKLSETPREY